MTAKDPEMLIRKHLKTPEGHQLLAQSLERPIRTRALYYSVAPTLLESVETQEIPFDAARYDGKIEGASFIQLDQEQSRESRAIAEWLDNQIISRLPVRESPTVFEVDILDRLIDQQTHQGKDLGGTLILDVPKYTMLRKRGSSRGELTWTGPHTHYRGLTLRTVKGPYPWVVIAGHPQTAGRFHLSVSVARNPDDQSRITPVPFITWARVGVDWAESPNAVRVMFQE